MSLIFLTPAEAKNLISEAAKVTRHRESSSVYGLKLDEIAKDPKLGAGFVMECPPERAKVDTKAKAWETQLRGNIKLAAKRRGLVVQVLRAPSKYVKTPNTFGLLVIYDRKMTEAEIAERDKAKENDAE